MDPGELTNLRPSDPWISRDLHDLFSLLQRLPPNALRLNGLA